MTGEELILQELQKINGRLDQFEQSQNEMRNDLAGVKNDLAGVKNDLADVKVRLDKLEKAQIETKIEVQNLAEFSEETRDGVNALIVWAEECSKAIRFPLPRIK